MTDTPAPPPAPYLGQFITETTEVTVPFTTAVLVLDRDGSRRIVMHTLADSGEFYHWHTQRERLGVRADGAPMVFWGVSNAPQLYNGLHPGKYLPYPPADGIAVPAVDDPVNPVPYLLPYRSHAARFAHQLDDAMGHHTLQSATEEDRLTVYHALVFMIGVAARKYQEWADVDPQEIIVGGTNDGTLLWKRYLEEYTTVDEILCGQCDIATFARRFLFHGDLPAFRRLHRQGIVYSADRSTDPWSPELFDVATAPAEDYYEELEAYYQGMLRYYDDVSGVQDHGEA